MPREVEFKTRWEETGEGQVCKVTSIDSRTRRILASLNINVPVYTAADFKAIYGDSLKKEIEKAAEEIAKNIAERTP